MSIFCLNTSSSTSSPQPSRLAQWSDPQPPARGGVLEYLAAAVEFPGQPWKCVQAARPQLGSLARGQDGDVGAEDSGEVGEEGRGPDLGGPYAALTHTLRPQLPWSSVQAQEKSPAILFDVHQWIHLKPLRQKVARR